MLYSAGLKHEKNHQVLQTAPGQIAGQLMKKSALVKTCS